MKIICGDCINKLDMVENKSVQLICIDPPYNIGKDIWDNKWKREKKGYIEKAGDDYYLWMNKIFCKLEMKLKDNGSLFFFHNDFRIMSKLDEQIDKNTNLKLKQFIVWNKRFDGSKNKGFLDGFIAPSGLNNFQKMAEYILFYTFDNSWKLRAKRKELNIKQQTISSKIKSKTGGITGWYSNLETGKNYPTKETIKPIKKYLGINYDDIVPKFNNMKTHHSVWNYELERKKIGHITPKPVELIKNIILHTTDENDIVLDCFAGSGTLGIACLETNRDFILIEKDEKYINLINYRIKNFLNNKKG